MIDSYVLGGGGKVTKIVFSNNTSKEFIFKRFSKVHYTFLIYLYSRTIDSERPTFTRELRKSG